jgi:hypothetical protein
VSDTTPRPVFDSYDPALPELKMAGASEMTGIPDYRGIRTTWVGPSDS